MFERKSSVAQRKNFYLNMKIKRKQMNYYWQRFTYLVELSYRYDKNSEEYSKINKLAWTAFDRWSSLFLTGYTEEITTFDGTFGGEE